MSFIFHIDLSLGILTVSDVNQGPSLILPSGNFPGEGGIVPFRADMHGKYLIKIPKQYVILPSIEWRTRW